MSDERLAETPHPPHDLITRGLHWINTIAIAVLVVSGTAIGLGGEAEEEGASFLPPAFLHAIGHGPHNAFAFVFMFAGVIYALLLVASGRWRMFFPGSFTAGYSIAQRVAYAIVILMAFGEALTGCALLFGRNVPWLADAFGGRETVTSIHVALTFAIVAFVVGHVALAVHAGMPTLRSMIEDWPVAGRRTRANVIGMTAFIAIFVAVVGFGGNAISDSLRHNRPDVTAPSGGDAAGAPAGERSAGHDDD